MKKSKKTRAQKIEDFLKSIKYDMSGMDLRRVKFNSCKFLWDNMENTKIHEYFKEIEHMENYDSEDITSYYVH